MIPDIADTLTLHAAPAALDAGFRVTVTGLEIVGQPTFEQWTAFGVGLADKYNKLKWIIADWLAFGEDAYGDDIYQLASEYWQPQTIANYASTARRIPQLERRADVVFSIHSEVSSLTPEYRKYALDKVASKQWNREDLRDWKRSLKSGLPQAGTEQTITLQWKGHTVKDGMLTAVFVAPAEFWDIVEFKAVVRRKAHDTQAIR